MHVGILYDQPKFAEITTGANWIGVILSEPLDSNYYNYYKPFVDQMHAAGLTVAGTLYRRTLSATSDAVRKVASLGFDMIILDELLSQGVLTNPQQFNKLASQAKSKAHNLKIGLSDFDMNKLESFLKRGAKPDFIARTCYTGNLQTLEQKVDVVVSLGISYGIPAYVWINFADSTATTTTDQATMSTLASYAASKANGVWFWEYGDQTESDWIWGDWYLTNYPYVRNLVGLLQQS